MPIEAHNLTDPAGDNASIGGAYLGETRRTLKQALRKIAHCLNQLTDDDLQWRQALALPAIVRRAANLGLVFTAAICAPCKTFRGKERES